MYEGLSFETSSGYEAKDYLAGVYRVLEVRECLPDKGLYHDSPDSEDKSKREAVCSGGSRNLFGFRDYGQGGRSLEYETDG